MPELPEIEHLRRTLRPRLVGAVVIGVELRRPDIVRSGGREAAALLAGSRIINLVRHGKNLAILADTGNALGMHLGMSGQMRFLREGESAESLSHVHCLWRISSPGAGRNGQSRQATLVFRDPRRFGGLRTFLSREDLAQHWSPLGPDALQVSAADLFARLERTARPVKAALLDQAVLAGVGNIYADEALFRARVHPAARACELKRPVVRRLAKAITDVLTQAVDAGGTTLRDYVDGGGERGGFSSRHRVYGRAGLPCTRCRVALPSIQVAQRTTVFCPRCQPC